MRHITAEQLVEQILENSGKSDSLHELQKGPQHAAQLSHEGHLSECRECAELKGEIEVLIHELLTDISYEPPPELVQWGMTLFQPLIQPQTGSKLRKLIAALVFDTFELRLQPGVRGVADRARRGAAEPVTGDRPGRVARPGGGVEPRGGDGRRTDVAVDGFLAPRDHGRPASRRGGRRRTGEGGRRHDARRRRADRRLARGVVAHRRLHAAVVRRARVPGPPVRRSRC